VAQSQVTDYSESGRILLAEITFASRLRITRQNWTRLT
jgi:hypothetical protein